jgi:hypothetical protein
MQLLSLQKLGMRQLRSQSFRLSHGTGIIVPYLIHQIGGRLQVELSGAGLLKSFNCCSLRRTLSSSSRVEGPLQVILHANISASQLVCHARGSCRGLNSLLNKGFHSLGEACHPRIQMMTKSIGLV